MKRKYCLHQLRSLQIPLDKPTIVFLTGDLGAGKTTISQHILTDILGINEAITSPTYTYYNKYGENYHFDLYRIQNYDEFFAIGGEDILDNNSGVILIEWPEVISSYYKPDIEIDIHKTQNGDEREIEIINHTI